MNYKKYAFLLSLIPFVLSGCGVTSSSEDVTSMPSISIESSQPLSETYWDVTFDLNKVDAGEVANQAILHNGKVTRPNYTYPHEDDVFLGWFKDQYALVSWNFNVERVTSNLTLFGGWQSIIDSYNPGTSEPGSDYDYYDSDFFPTTYTVVFNSNYENGPVITRNVIAGNSAKAPSISRGGYKLLDWYLEQETINAFDFKTPIESELQLFAKWEELNSFTIFLDLNYVGAPTPSSVVGYEGLKLSVPETPVRDNYDFIGWYKEATLINVWNFSTELVTESLTLYAKWARLPLPGVYVLMSDLWLEDNATFQLWHGSGTVNTNGVATGIPNEYYFNNTATSHLAIKRYVNSGIVGQVYNIAPSGGFGTTWNQIVIKSTTSKNNTNLSQLTGDYVTLQIRDNSVDEDLLLHDVTFNYNYVGGPSNLIKQVMNNSKVTAPSNPTRTDYSFLGWFTSAELTTLFDFNTLIVEPLTLFAGWQYVDPVSNATVTFNLNYSGAPTSPTSVVTVGSTVSEPSVSRSGYTLLGWYKEASTINKWNFATDTVLASMSLYAKWQQNEEVTLKGVYVLVNNAWTENSATFEIEFSGTKYPGVATGVTNEFYFDLIPTNAFHLLRKVNNVQVAKIFNIATWVQTGADYRSFGTSWNRVTLRSDLANNVSNEPATNAVTYDLRPSSATATLSLSIKRKED